MKATFAADKRRPGSYLARVELTPDEPEWPEVGDTVTLMRKDGSTSKVKVGKVVWSGPDAEKPGVEVALYMITESLDENKARQPPGSKRAAPPK